MIKKLLSLFIILTFLSSPVWSDTDISEEQCVDDNPEILIDLGGSLEPERIIYSVYDSCTERHDYCGSSGCDLAITGNKDTKGRFDRITRQNWYIMPSHVLGRDPTYEVYVPTRRGGLSVIKVVDNELTETVIEENELYETFRGTIPFPDTGKYVGEIQNGKFHGNGIEIYSDGRRFFGEYSNGKKNGSGVMYETDGEQYIGTWKDDVRVGAGNYVLPDGTVQSGSWIEGKFIFR